MLNKLKQFFEPAKRPLSAEEKTQQLNLAAASLLLEVVMADDIMTDDEAKMLPTLLTTTLGLSVDDIDSLVSKACDSQRRSTSLFDFTQTINDNFNVEQKQHLILAMWRIAYADGHLCQYEEQIIRRTSELLYLRHSELIQMRNLVMESKQS
ncbi:TerB family tellurite resistance protein [Shewanella sp.]|nr:TerB family tellurite resistance protein [Shewanella sp.]